MSLHPDGPCGKRCVFASAADGDPFSIVSDKIASFPISSTADVDPFCLVCFLRSMRKLFLGGRSFVSTVLSCAPTNFPSSLVKRSFGKHWMSFLSPPADYLLLNFSADPSSCLSGRSPPSQRSSPAVAPRKAGQNILFCARDFPPQSPPPISHFYIFIRYPRTDAIPPQ